MAATTEELPCARRSALAVPVAGLVFLLLSGLDPAASTPSFTGRAALLLVAGVAGLPLLAALALRRDGAAVLGVAFVTCAGVSGLLARTPLSWSGAFPLGTGAVFVATLGGAWAIGRNLDGSARPLVAGAFLGGALVNAAVALLQGPFDLSGLGILLFDGRATGLLGNPVFLGAVCAAGAALVPDQAVRRPVPAALALVVLGAGIAVSGSRVALPLAAGALLAGIRRAGLARTSLLVLVLAVGVGAGSAAAPGREESSALARLDSQPASGLGGRVESWKGALSAIADRPLLGAGPGRYAAATAPYRTLALARAFRPSSVFLDAHNLMVEYAVTTGLLGLLLLLGWIAASLAAARPSSEPALLAAAVVLLAGHLVGPQNVALTPLAFLLVGASAARPAAPPPRRTGIAAAVLGVVSLVPAVALLAGDGALKTAVTRLDRPAAERAASLLRPWSLPLAVRTGIDRARYDATHRRADLAAALAAARQAVAREPDDANRWVSLGMVYETLGRPDRAAASYRRALLADPWSDTALALRAASLTGMGRTAEAGACRRLVLAVIGDKGGLADEGGDRRACLSP